MCQNTGSRGKQKKLTKSWRQTRQRKKRKRKKEEVQFSVWERGGGKNWTTTDRLEVQHGVARAEPLRAKRRGDNKMHFLRHSPDAGKRGLKKSLGKCALERKGETLEEHHLLNGGDAASCVNRKGGESGCCRRERDGVVALNAFPR